MDSTRDDLASVWGTAAARSGRAPRVLGFFAHPDDEVFCAGGLIARCAEAGAVTAIVSLTQGEAGQIRDAAAATRRTLGPVRVKELEQSGVALGADYVTCLDLGDGRLAERSPTELAAIARSVVDEFGPDAVVTFGPDGACGHPDHVASSRAMADAVAAMPDPPRLLHARFPMREQLLLDVLVDWLTSSTEQFRGTAAFGHALKLFADGSSMMGFAADHVDVQYFPAGSFVIEQGEPATDLFCILSGSVEVVVEADDGRTHHVRSAGAGCFVGEDALASGRLQNAHVIARQDVTCLVLAPDLPSCYGGRGASATPPAAGAPAVAAGPSPNGPGAELAGTATDRDADTERDRCLTIDVRPVIRRKLAALAAHRSQYAMDADLFPGAVVERLLGTEHFAVVTPGGAGDVDVVADVVAGGPGPATATATENTPLLEGTAPGPYAPEGLAPAEQAFLSAFPTFDPSRSFTELRRREYGRLDDEGHVYLDYTGGGLHAMSQVDAHAESLRRQVLGNPHSNNPTSLASTDAVARARRFVCEYFNAPADEYLCIFTANASAALKLVGESYRFEPGGTFALTFDNHNSVNGIREFAERKGASVAYVPVVAPDLRLDRDAMTAVLQAGDPSKRNLLAFPAQSNFSGVQHPLDLVDEAHEAGWDVLLDAAAFVPTNRLDVARIRPDFVSLSFYKMFGFPTGVGCLLMRRDRFDSLVRPWFAGGTVTIASVQGHGHYLHRDEAGFEDGTVDYLNLPAVETGLRHLRLVGVDAIHERVMALTQWLLEALGGLRHTNGRPAVQIHGPTGTDERGGTVTFMLRDPDGRPIDDRRVEELANRAKISLRTGCFCNPGAGEIAHHLGAGDMARWFGREEPMSFRELRASLLRDRDLLVGAVRVSFGVASSFADAHRFMCFVQGLLDRSAAEIVGKPAEAEVPTAAPGHGH